MSARCPMLLIMMLNPVPRETSQCRVVISSSRANPILRTRCQASHGQYSSKMRVLCVCVRLRASVRVLVPVLALLDRQRLISLPQFRTGSEGARGSRATVVMATTSWRRTEVNGCIDRRHHWSTFMRGGNFPTGNLHCSIGSVAAWAVPTLRCCCCCCC